MRWASVGYIFQRPVGLFVSASALSTSPVLPPVRRFSSALGLCVKQSSLHPFRGSTLPSTSRLWVRGFAAGTNARAATMSEFVAEHAKTGRSGCKECKQKIDKGALRIGKVTTSPFSDDSDMTTWYHDECFFQAQLRSRKTTAKVETLSDIKNYAELSAEDKQSLKTKIAAFVEAYANKGTGGAGGAKAKRPAAATTATASQPGKQGPALSATGPYHSSGRGRDNSFAAFQELCRDIEAHPGHTDKGNIIRTFITKGTSGQGFTGDLYLVMRHLLPQHPKRVYNMKEKQLVKIFSALFHTSEQDLTEHLEQGDVSDTMASFFATSQGLRPAAQSTLSLEDVENLLRQLENRTTIDEQTRVFRQHLPRMTTEDLRYVVRHIKHDLRIFAGSKIILSALNPGAYEAWKASNDLYALVQRCLKHGPSLKRDVSVRASLMTPVKPMLAEACRSYEMAVQKCPNGILAEIKYDGERVQVHKQGDNFRFFSRSLKEVQDHKISFFRESIRQACPHGHTMILDAEVLMVDTTTSKPLPFGTLGVHKKTRFTNAQPCLFIFDILHFNGRNLMDETMEERRRLLTSHVVSVHNEIMYSEQTAIPDLPTLRALMTKVMRENLEGLVLKDRHSVYEPSKRHWLKMKKDYLESGAMADTADLALLGAWFGTGSKGGLLSVYLMGCRDDNGVWRTVTKCGNGFDDAQVDAYHRKMLPLMQKVSQDRSKVPGWLRIDESRLVPDYIIRDPNQAPILEIAGAEFSESRAHSADGISIRFPRIARVRSDKNADTATSLSELKVLFKASKASSELLPNLPTSGNIPTSDQVSAAVAAAPPASSGSARRPEPAPKRTKRTLATMTATATSPKPRSCRRRAPDEDEDEDEPNDYDLNDDFINDDLDEDEDEDAADNFELDSDGEAPHVGDVGRRPRSTRARRTPGGRVPCYYGAACYRRRPEHRVQFSHPGDPDYPNYRDEDAEEDEDEDEDGVAQPHSEAESEDDDFVAEEDQDTEPDEPAPHLTGPPAHKRSKGHTDDHNSGTHSSLDSGTGGMAVDALPDVFSGCVCLVDGCSDAGRARRAIIAFDGEVVTLADDELSHIVVGSRKSHEWPPAVQHAVKSHPDAIVVHESWLWDSSKAGKRLSELKYSV
ncbi:uncharacterized protein MONBRDRAFT_25238 [Monosiga brevicollis MX1]|uniref:DNA ligase n=1 Tax=Monosiga brevicollis TaxID=81824 RepID=A9UYT8_MONBE|nr:uncharacterized protein MONBRDRAFT_25238 [Monosiga brevicollis MX1]EDQ89519.1 predicted protein [Monosiga brevicollis MX1]|eukprot:XP_001745548.1 hypothetical protein [Monosiga brevicollis MX1]